MDARVLVVEHRQPASSGEATARSPRGSRTLRTDSLYFNFDREVVCRAVARAIPQLLGLHIAPSGRARRGSRLLAAMGLQRASAL